MRLQMTNFGETPIRSQ